MNNEVKASNLALIGNLFLFIIKIVIGIIYNSISLISEALNSFSDIISSIAVTISVYVSHEQPDRKHQFGHTRAQPIAGLIVAIFISIVGYQVISSSVMRLISGETMVKGLLPLFVMVIVFFTKLFLYIYTKKIWLETRSVALKATLIDHKNDILISITVFGGLIFTNLGYGIADSIIGIVVGIYILKAGFEIGKENINYLMGVAPSEYIFKKIEKISGSVNGVIGLNDIKAHMLGTNVDVEVNIYVDKNLNIKKAHDIGVRVQQKLQNIKEIHRAHVHIDPFFGKFKKKRRF